MKRRRKDIVGKTYTDLRYRITLHLLFWVVMFFSYYYFNTISFTPASGTPAAYWLAVKNVLEYALAFYSLMYWIWPQFIKKSKWLLVPVLLFIWLVAITAFDGWIDQLLMFRFSDYQLRMKNYYVDYYNFLHRNFPYIVFIRVVTGGLLYHLLIQLSFPIAIKIGRSYFRQTVQQLQLSKDNLQLELNFLKAQVNPHFLFNTLNNIYSLVMSDRKEQAGHTIARLSSLLRYTLYETADEKIALDKEVQLLKDYVELEKLRLNDTEVQFHYEKDSDDYTIPPLLLMPALENAFKYSSDKNESSIVIDIKAKEATLQVDIQNHFDPQRKNKTGGIGLQNLQKRLQHYFPNSSAYTATVVNDVYLFHLSCALQ
jgi:sensor histidine kinase YesM